MLKTSAERIAGDCFGVIGQVRVQQVIDLVKQTLLQPVGGAPIHKKGTLVFKSGAFFVIVGAKICYLVAALAHLEFPTRHAGINQQVRIGAD